MNNQQIKDLSGMRFGTLTVTDRHESRREKSGNVYTYWLCKCDCGNEVWRRGTGLSYKPNTVCGKDCKFRKWYVKHGQTDSRIYRIYYDMLQRCFNPKHASIDHYGGRGITVCPEWLGENGFVNFYEWSMKNGYEDDLTLDRIDVNGNYEPSNCRWTPWDVQSLNKTNTVYMDDGITPIKMVSDENNVPYARLKVRKKSGWSDDDMLDDIPAPRLIKYNGKEYTALELAKVTGISVNTINSRINYGFSDEEICDPSNAAPKVPVEQYDLEGNLIAIYESAAEASKQTGVSRSGILMCTNGHRRQCKGFIWKKGDYEEKKRIERCLRHKEGGGWIDNRGKSLK